MSGEKQPKKHTNNSPSDHSDEGPRPEHSPDDAEDRCLLPVQSPAAAEVPSVTSESGASSSNSTNRLTRLFGKHSPFKSETQPPCKKLKKESKFAKAKNAFRRTFRKSDSSIRETDPELEEKRRRKLSDPTHLKIKHEPVTPEQETKTAEKTGAKAKRSLFGRYTGSPIKETEDKTAETGAKSKKGLFGHFSGSAFNPESKKKTDKTKTSKKAKTSPETKKKTEKSKSKKETSPEVKKKALSPRPSNQPSIGGVSVGFFNEGLLSESSGVATESTSLEIRSASSYSPDGPSSRRPTISRKSKESDIEFSSSE